MALSKAKAHGADVSREVTSGVGDARTQEAKCSVTPYKDSWTNTRCGGGGDGAGESTRAERCERQSGAIHLRQGLVVGGSE